MEVKEAAVRAESGKTVMHFSDGVMEVEAVDNAVRNATPAVESCDPKTLNWAPWTLHMTKQAGVKTLEVCDYLGESLASFFGITTPKYQFEINEYHKMQKAAEEEKKDVEMGNWSKPGTETILKPPESTLPRF